MFITGTNAGETYDAWLCSLADIGVNTLALVIVVNYRNDTQMNLIYTVLDSMEIVPLDDV
jgi:hypothetical protein